ncbi:MAG: hypothetical protein SV775_05835, partial [Thermodesulfobacteriota bacterium]|nr:hypothetical protein [Thermodesulfobacteriota bacterium]
MIIPSANHLTKIPELNRPVTSLKGIGAKRAELLEQKGLHTLLDIIFFIPIRYEDRSRLLYINEVVGGTAVLVRGNVVSAGGERSLRGGRRLFRIIISDETAELELLWFHYKKAHLSRFALPGLELMAYGSIQMNRGKRQMIHPDITTVNKEKENETLGFCPVYRGVKGLSGRVLRSAISQALDQCQEALVDGIPPEITSRLGLPMLGEAIRRVHFPVEGSSIDLLNQFKTKYHQRLTFDRFFGVMLNIALRKKSREERAGLVFSIPEDLPRSVEKHFPFSLTSDQNRAIHEILSDLAGDKPMNRLLQGDVGCGKTVVAAVASYATVLNHWQVAIMVPTLVLAQ